MKKNELFQHTRKMQDLSFRTVQEFLDFLPADELSIVEKIRDLVYQAIPDCHEKLSYNVPYFKRHANICFIWPGSIPWGKVRQEGVRLGFTKGYLLQDDINFLDKGNRKEVYWKDFRSMEELDEVTLLTYLSRASDIDEDVYQKR